MRREGASAPARRRSASGSEPPHPRYRIEHIKVRGRRARVRARLSYGVNGREGRLRLATASCSRRKRDGRWRLDRALGDPQRRALGGRRLPRAPSRHFVVWSPRPGIAAAGRPLEAGYARLRQLARRAASKRRYLVVVARDGEHARRLTSSIAGLESLTALTDTQIQVARPALRVTDVASQRLIINLPQYLAAPDQTQVIAHELTHAALAPTTSGRAPAWLVEGVALYVSADDRRDRVRRAAHRPDAGRAERAGRDRAA